nr:tripartite tricarboxylate transporter TctB family protein [Sedimentibacter sp.]
MVLELAFNVALLVFFVYCFFYVGSKAPESVPGTMNGAQWPQILIVLLVIFLAINIIKILQNKKQVENIKINFNLRKILQSKLSIGIILLLLYSYALDYIGFIVNSLIFFVLYSRLLGEKRIRVLLLSAFVSVAILYLIFNTALGIMLPRGTGIFRTFALFIESLL